MIKQKKETQMAADNALVLVPGLLCTAELFAPQVADLADVTRLKVADHTTRDTLQGIARAILAAAPPTFALAGLSMGGYVAFEMLRQAPERITRLALLDTNARADRPEQSELRRNLVALAREKGVKEAARQLWPLLVHRDRQADEGLRALVLRMAEETGLEAFVRQQEAIIGRPDNRPFLAGIRCPTVIVVGAEDAITPVKVAEEMQAGIAGSRLAVIPDCGHLSTLERPQAVSAVLRTWLGA